MTKGLQLSSFFRFSWRKRKQSNTTRERETPAAEFISEPVNPQEEDITIQTMATSVAPEHYPVLTVISMCAAMISRTWGYARRLDIGHLRTLHT